MMPGRSLNTIAKACAYRSGLLSVWHSLRNRHSLTVVIFHRVLPRDHPAWSYSDTAWIVSDTAFHECLRFFRRHYTVIGLDDVTAIADGRTAPPHPLLITFDDGWADTAEFALPLLRAEGLPAAVFVVSGAVGKHELWQEAVIRVHRQQGLVNGSLRRVWDLIDSLESLEPSVRDTRLRTVIDGPGAPRDPQMLSAVGLRLLRDHRVVIGSHGVTHTPIPQAADPGRELRCSRSSLATLLNDSSHAGLEAFAFPHGRYDDRAIAIAAEAGYRLLFTSDARLNPMPRAGSAPVVLGRINIPFGIVADARGRFSPESLASWLFLRPHRP